MIFGGIDLNFWQFTPSSLPHSPFTRGRPCGGWGYPKMKIEIIFEIPTIENPKIDISLNFLWYRILPLQTPPLRAPFGGLKGYL